MDYDYYESVQRSTNSILKHLQTIALCFYAFSLNIEFFDPFNSGGSFSFAKLAGLIYLFFIFLSFNKYFILRKRIIYCLWPIWGVFLVMTINGLAHINSLSSNFFDVAFFLNLIMIFVMINHGIVDTKVLDLAMLSFAIGAAIISIFMFLGIGVEEIGQGRIKLIGTNINSLGIKLSIAFSILMSFFYNDRLKFGVNRYWFVLAIPFLLTAIVQTGSRSALLVMILTFLTMIFLFKGKNIIKRIIFYLMAIALFSLGIEFILNSDVMMARLSSLAFEASERDGMGVRLDVWAVYIPLALENPIIGLGKTGFEYEAIQLFGGVKSPHNVVLEIMLYSGIVGVILFLFFIFKIMRCAFLAYRYSSNELPILLLPAIFVMVGANQVLNIKVSWFLFAYIVVIYLKHFRLRVRKISSNENTMYY
ncbi:hypothetical protein Tel_08610 [Candidatus Tenderia electrophaga]|jgi:O-antigen ligase|uniref:O-antigen ligase-related domain-containing protein n=1 Tax=Candidatus Tenderia electrophaga TaxID=1748243 RepID=A0A0S2TDH8_9GAMM|nr:hypothetical protein Tel_08610 [Candidatus Tenderia electrophaga]